MLKRAEIKEVLVGRLERGDDLYEVLTGVCRGVDVRLGRLTALGAVECARIGFYHQADRRYDYLELDRPLEILALVGNISLKAGEPFLHAHVTLGDEEGRAFGGHLAPGTRVFACEYMVEVLDGVDLHRCEDEATGLFLWQRDCAG